MPWASSTASAGTPLFQGHTVAGGEVEIRIVTPDIDGDEHIIGFEQVTVGGIMKVDLQNLAISAPVATEIEQDALLFPGGLDQRGRDIGFALGAIRVNDRPPGRFRSLRGSRGIV